jgi:hypothetical protein
LVLILIPYINHIPLMMQNRVLREAEANKLKLTPEFLELKFIEAIANNTKMFFGEKVRPSLGTMRQSSRLVITHDKSVLPHDSILSMNAMWNDVAVLVLENVLLTNIWMCSLLISHFTHLPKAHLSTNPWINICYQYLFKPAHHFLSTASLCCIVESSNFEKKNL